MVEKSRKKTRDLLDHPVFTLIYQIIPVIFVILLIIGIFVILTGINWLETYGTVAEPVVWIGLFVILVSSYFLVLHIKDLLKERKKQRLLEEYGSAHHPSQEEKQELISRMKAILVSFPKIIDAVDLITGSIYRPFETKNFRCEYYQLHDEEEGTIARRLLIETKKTKWITKWFLFPKKVPKQEYRIISNPFVYHDSPFRARAHERLTLFLRLEVKIDDAWCEVSPRKIRAIIDAIERDIEYLPEKKFKQLPDSI